jgi:hypothetical protein
LIFTKKQLKELFNLLDVIADKLDDDLDAINISIDTLADCIVLEQFESMNEAIVESRSLDSIIELAVGNIIEFYDDDHEDSTVGIITAIYRGKPIEDTEPIKIMVLVTHAYGDDNTISYLQFFEPLTDWATRRSTIH